MLDIIRRKQKSVIIKVVFWTIIAAFVGTIFLVWGKGSDKGQYGGSVAVSIDGTNISYEDYQEAYSNLYRIYQNIYRENFSPVLEKQLGLRKQALDGLIEQTLLLQEADKLDLSVSRKELVESIAEFPAFQENGTFNKDRYIQVLNYQRMTPDYFESMQERDLLIGKVRDRLKALVTVTDEDIDDEYRRENEQVNLSFLAISPALFKSRVKIDENELKTFYNDHREEYRLPETVALHFVRFDPARYENEVTFTEEELQKYYRRHLDRYETPEQVKASHILIKVPNNADAKLKETKLALAEKILQEVRSGKDFAELARKKSDDPGSASKGGSLGYFTRGTMVEPFEKAAFTLKPGEVSDVVESPFGFHIIKVEEYVEGGVKPIEDVLDDVKSGLKQELVRQIAFEKALDAYNINRKAGSLDAAAQANDLKIQETGFFSRGDLIEGIGSSPEITAAAFTLQQGELGRPVALPDGVYLFAVSERKESRIPDLEDIKSAVEESFRTEKAKILAKEAAMETLEAAREGSSLTRLARKEGVSLEETGFFGRSYGAFIPRIGSSDDLSKTAFNLSEENPLPSGIFEVDGKYVVIRLKERHEADMKGLDDTKREELRNSLLQRRGEEAVKSKLEELRANAKIEIAPALQSTLESE